MSDAPPRWLSRTVVGIVVATFFSDVGHEMVTAVLPFYVASIGLGAGALGLAIVFLTRDRAPASAPDAPAVTADGATAMPRDFWLFVGGVLLFGLGDFSRTFLIFLAARALGDSGDGATMLSTAVLLYAGHNLVSALAAYPAGRLGDAWSRPRVLVIGYGLGVVTNVVLAAAGASLPWLIAAIALSGVYIAIQETLEKAVVVAMLPRSRRSLGLGYLASANALGDLGSSVFVGLMLAAGHDTLAFAGPATVGALGVAWMAILLARGRLR